MPLCVALLHAWRARAVRVVGAAMAARPLATLAAVALLAGIGASLAPAAARPVKVELSTSDGEGYARLVLRFSEEIDADARHANNIVIISFKTRVDLVVDRLSEMVPGYISAARRDPDGKGLRIALARKVTMNTMMVGERMFIDLLPDGWSGPPPGLPKEVVEELARRAREAEKKVKKQQQIARQRQLPLIRVRVGHQPTFSRYIFDLAELVPVASSREKDTLSLVFDAPLKFDLADAKASPPPMIETIDTELREHSTIVRFNFIGNVDVRTFREDESYVVDVGAVEPVRRRSEKESEGRSATKRSEAASPAFRPEPGRAALPEHAVVSERGAAPERPGPPRRAPVPEPAAAGLEAPQSVPAVDTATPSPAKPAPAQPAAAMSDPALAPPVAAPAAAPVPAVVALPPPVPPASVDLKPPLPPAPAGVQPAAMPAPFAAKPAPPAEPPVPPLAVPPAVMPPVQLPDMASPIFAKVVDPAAAPAARVTEPGLAAPVAPSVPVPVVADLDLPPDYAPPGAAAPPPNAAPPPHDRGKRNVSLTRHGDNLVVTFALAKPTAAAVFQRADNVWVVFDGDTKVDVTPLNADSSRTIKRAALVPAQTGQAVRIRLERPRLTTLHWDGAALVVTIGHSMPEPPRPLGIMRNASGANRATAAIPFDEPRTVHRIVDPEAGDTLLVVTALGPSRGFLRTQDHVEFRALASSHGVAIQPLADDLSAELTADKIVIMRPNGLILSTGDAVVRRAGSFRPALFDPQLWGFDREAEFDARRTRLLNAAAEAVDTKRTAPRLELARFYLARAMYPEAKGVLDVALSDEKPSEEPAGLVMRAFANIMIGHVNDALKDLSHPIVGSQHDSQVWRGLAFARQGNWSDAHQNLHNVEAAISGLPIELQRLVLKEAVRASIEVHDFAMAGNQMHGFETLGVTKAMEPDIALLAGRISEGLGRSGDALVSYRMAAGSTARPAVAQGRLRETVLRYQLGDLKRSEVISDLEELTTVWRGDDTEIEALQLLARLYTQEARYRDAFHVMRVALMAHPNSDMTRRIQEEAAATFDSLFLAGKGDGMPVIDALGLFYDFRELTPIGRRGDEMIRRLADRLVSVDLLDQAAELLQHQVDHRLQGAARAQVAIRLAVIYLMNRKPDRAVAVLNATQASNISTEMRHQRLLIEARALSDIGRTELALELIGNIETREATRLRADILWAGKRWREAAEQIEVLYGERWRDFQPLTDSERADLLRAAVGLALAQDGLGLDRLRERYEPKMTTTPERRAFEVATAPLSARTAEFRTLARAIAAGDTLEGFLRDMRTRYPETGSFSARSTAGQQSRAPMPDPTPTGSIAPRRADAMPNR
jgi:hypothetical protein